ncbi:MAG: uncharacterized protein K0Q97_3062 [Bacillota bacterium]|nr:uncharacterized protein [Bacillota bacterium]
MNILKIKRVLLIIIGSISLVLGVIGILIPVLPTTPFLLLSSFCYLRSSEKLYNWLINHRVFGPYIYNYLTYKAIPKKTKIGAIIFLWCSLILSSIIISSLHIKIFLFLIGIAVSLHIITLKTLSQENLNIVEEQIIKK